MTTITITVNGDERQIDAAITVADFLTQHDLQAKMVVVEHNLKILSRDQYANTVLNSGDNLEIVQMMAGG